MKVVPPIHCFHICSFNFKVWPRDPQSQSNTLQLQNVAPPNCHENNQHWSPHRYVSLCWPARKTARTTKKHQTASNGDLILSSTNPHGSGRLGVWDVRENGPADCSCAGFTVLPSTGRNSASPPVLMPSQSAICATNTFQQEVPVHRK